ncbi:MAG: MFS transporter [Pirellulales bacterium]|nr:MFS transporter [Pirellulales bacterium]
MKYKTLPIFLAFFVMGVADAMGPLSNAVKNDYKISNVMATLLSFFVFIAFAAFSVPGGLLAARIGKKNLLLLGLGLNAFAVFIPALSLPHFALLLGCIFLLGIGTTFLQVAGNPIMRDVSPSGAYSKNLSFAQGIKGIGSTASTFMPVLIGAIAFLTAMKWRGVFPVYFAFMVVAFAAVALLKVNETKAEVPPSIGSSLGLLAQPIFFLAVLGIFLYVGAEVCMARFLEPTLTGVINSEFKEVRVDKIDREGKPVLLLKYNPQTGHEEPLTDPAVIQEYQKTVDLANTLGPTMFFLLLTVGRIGGGVVLSFLSPRIFFRISALLGVLGCVALMGDNKIVAVGGVVAGALGFANIWPLLFSITVEEKPECANELSGLMCMAISGGALIPLLMSQLFDWRLGTIAFIVPTACFAYLLLLSLRGGRSPAQA